MWRWWWWWFGAAAATAAATGAAAAVRVRTCACVILSVFVCMFACAYACACTRAFACAWVGGWPHHQSVGGCFSYNDTEGGRSERLQRHQHFGVTPAARGHDRVHAAACAGAGRYTVLVLPCLVTVNVGPYVPHEKARAVFGHGRRRTLVSRGRAKNN